MIIDFKDRREGKYVPKRIKQCSRCISKDVLGYTDVLFTGGVCISCIVEEMMFQDNIERRIGTHIYALIAGRRIFGGENDVWNATKELEFKNRLLSVILMDVIGLYEGSLANWYSFYGDDDPHYLEQYVKEMSVHFSDKEMEVYLHQIRRVLHNIMYSRCVCDASHQSSLWAFCNCKSVLDFGADEAYESTAWRLSKVKELQMHFPYLKDKGLFVTWNELSGWFNVMTYNHECLELSRDQLRQGGYEENSDGEYDRHLYTSIELTKRSSRVRIYLYY